MDEKKITKLAPHIAKAKAEGAKEHALLLEVLKDIEGALNRNLGGGVEVKIIPVSNAEMTHFPHCFAPPVDPGVCVVAAALPIG